jgi:hypothetical protein
MKFKTYTEGDSTLMSQTEKDILRRIEQMMDHFPDDEDYGTDDKGKPVVLSCHIVVRAVAQALGGRIEVVDGHYFPCFDHSWLKTEEGNVIDVYPVGIVGGPIFVHRIVADKRCRIVLFDEEREEVGLYLHKDLSRKADFDSRWFKDAVDKIARSIAAACI